jgi:hypothetical protein
VTGQLVLTADPQTGLGVTLRFDALAEADHFLSAHPGAERFILDLIDADMASGTPLSMDYYCHCLRRSGLLPPGEGHRFTLNDHIVSVLNLYFKETYRLPLRTRASKYDGLGAL